jgi:hypothetical protein
MEKNRSLIFRVIGSVLVLGVAAAVLFGLTGVLHDPSVETAVQAEKASVAQRAPETSTPSSGPPTAQAPAGPDGGTQGEIAKGEEQEPFPQFDEEPTGS